MRRMLSDPRGRVSLTATTQFPRPADGDVVEFRFNVSTAEEDIGLDWAMATEKSEGHR
jgi:hypothetical protein